MKLKPQCDWIHDLFFPTLLFMALGGMTWAVRGCSGFGAAAGCIFAGVMWGAAWWYLAYEPTGEQTRRYSSAWIVLSMTLAFGYSGARGWMQWPSFFDGHLDTNVDKHEWVPISPRYGFLWLFIAGVPWAGLGGCALAWCGTLRATRAWHWVLRIGVGVGCAYLARHLYDTYPAYFLPLYEEYESRYRDLRVNPNLRRLINDSGAAIFHLGLYLGFLLFELLRRDWKNITLILTVGILNGAGWAAFQNWKWANRIWSSGDFNFWRCWESSGGLSIGFAYGIAYFLVNRQMSAQEREIVAARQSITGPNFEWLLVCIGMAAYLSPFLRSITAGWSVQYLTVLYAFAGFYYLFFRKSATARPTLAGWFAAPLVLAFVTGNYFMPVMRRFIEQLLSEFVEIAGSGGPWYTEAAEQFRSWLFKDQTRFTLAYTYVEIAIGLVWLALFSSKFAKEKAAGAPKGGDPILESFGLGLGLLTGLGLSIRNGAKGWFNIYLGDERYWSEVLWRYLGPTSLVILLLLALWTLYRRASLSLPKVRFLHAYGAIWLVLIVQNIIAQLITGPLSQWHEVAFSIYYVLLFFVTTVIVIHVRFVKSLSAPDVPTPTALSDGHFTKD